MKTLACFLLSLVMAATVLTGCGGQSANTAGENSTPQADKKEKVVKGRELHNGLCVKQDYSNWIKKQLEVVDATEKDFYKLTFKDQLSKTGQTKIEYILKLEIAKEICLVAGASNRANNELKRKSKEYRRYLIAIEEILESI